MTSSKRTLLRVVVCGVLVGLVGCQYIQPVAAVLSLLVGRQERVVYVEVAAPKADGELGAPPVAPTTGR